MAKKHSMIGRMSMNQDKEINVILKKNVENDELEFQFENKIVISLTDTDNIKLKEVFEKILEELTKEKFLFKLEIESGYDVGLYKDVAEEYIKSLNQEIEELIETEEWKEISK